MAAGFLTQAQAALARPSANMSWAQLAAAVVFVLVVLIAWRQVIRFIHAETS